MAFGTVEDFEVRDTCDAPFFHEELGVLTGVLTDTDRFMIFLGFDFDLWLVEGTVSASLSEELTTGSLLQLPRLRG